jgi:transcriptional regulator with XRE-family HTH domain
MTKTHMALAPQLDRSGDESPFARARLQRQLTVEEAARRAGLTPDQVEWLEAARVYRFPSADDALLAALLYASALGVEQREARALAGLPVPPLVGGSARGRTLFVAALLATLAALVGAFLLGGHTGRAQTAAPSGPPLPATWKISVDVLNGSGDIVWTRQVASRIGALAYHVDSVRRADRFDYAKTAVYYEPGGAPVAVRLARALGVGTRALPGGTDPRRLVVIVGPHRGPA